MHKGWPENVTFHPCLKEIKHVESDDGMSFTEEIHLVDGTVIRDVDDDVAVDDALSTTADIGDVKFRPRDFVWTQTKRCYAIGDGVHGTLEHGFPIAQEVRVERI